MALPEIDVDFTRQDESGNILLDQADLSFYGNNPIGWKAFFCDGVSGAVGIIEEGPVGRLWHPPFVLHPEIPSLVRQILNMLDQLEEFRALPGRPAEDPEEDALLDEMDGVWYAMTPEERNILEYHIQKRKRECPVE